MGQNKKPTLARALLNLVTLVPSVFGFMNNLTALVNLEARLAGRSFVAIIVLAVVFGSLLTATWLGVLAMLFLYLTSLQWNPFLSLLIVLVLNIFILSCVGLSMLREKNNLFFPTTRKQIRNLIRLHED